MSYFLHEHDQDSQHVQYVGEEAHELSYWVRSSWQLMAAGGGKECSLRVWLLISCTCPSGELHTHECIRGRTWTQCVIKKKQEVLHERLELGVELEGVRD